MDIIKSSFHPKSNLDNLSNFKPYYRIEEDGTVYERIYLDIPDISLREQIICFHYLKNHVKVFFQEPIGFDIISRDDPWDFKIEMSTGEIFNIEITSIAEDKKLFEILKSEERFVINSIKDEFPFHELEKINKLFPSSEISELVSKEKDAGISNTDMITNPYKGQNPNLFMSRMSNKKEPLEILIQSAIESKEAKKHLEKENTVLLIDNRTLTYEYSDLHSASEKLQEFYEASSFREIWFYTGYCSDLDGNNAEFSLAPLKVTENQAEILIKTKEEKPPDKNGIILF